MYSKFKKVQIVILIKIQKSFEQNEIKLKLIKLNLEKYYLINKFIKFVFRNLEIN